MIKAIVDTHTVVWYVYGDARLSSAAKKFIDTAGANGERVGFSAISLIEIVYLIEKGQIQPETLKRIQEVIDGQDSVLTEIPVDSTIAIQMQNVPWKEVPDMPDRIIAATALQYKVPLISRDRKIRLSRVKTIWDK